MKFNERYSKLLDYAFTPDYVGGMPSYNETEYFMTIEGMKKHIGERQLSELVVTTIVVHGIMSQWVNGEWVVLKSDQVFNANDFYSQSEWNKLMTE